MAGWFGPRGDGIGFGPRSWQGWLVSALLIGGAVMEAKVFHPAQFRVARLDKARISRSPWPGLSAGNLSHL
ncbi:MAG TPA: hypothetical protein VG672_03595 [Bryobacteraceae bacterium]|nr:hypothetical protein [Bryobacteraceae bacterium]